MINKIVAWFKSFVKKPEVKTVAKKVVKTAIAKKVKK